MTNARTSTRAGQEDRDGSRFSARWRILGWLLLTTALALLAVIVVVNSTAGARVARDANTDVAQELNEFRQFAAEGVNPETAEPFTSVEPMLDVFLRRQHAGTGEVMIGVIDNAPTAMEVRGPQAPPRAEHDLAADPDAMAEVRAANSGIRETPAGELRWGKTEIVTNTGERGYLVVGIYTEPAYAEAAEIVTMMLWISLGALAFIAVIGWVIAGQILRPIRVMRKTAADISREDLTRRIPVQGNDDLADLAAEFNSMLDRLERAFAAEQRFVDDAGHELRTPITIIRGHLELLSDDPVERRATLHLVEQELDRMSRIVTDLLALAKAERPDYVRIDDPVDVAELTLDIDAKVQRLAARNWVLTSVADGRARIDAQRVTQAMLQLALNAVQHTADGDEIRISSAFGHDQSGLPIVEFAVTDRGPGVSPADAETIFERFGRGRGRTEDRGGAGLGLAIVRAIADGHEGSAYVDSVPGEGATFGVILPRRTDDGEPPTDEYVELLTTDGGTR